MNIWRLLLALAKQVIWKVEYEGLSLMAYIVLKIAHLKNRGHNQGAYNLFLESVNLFRKINWYGILFTSF